MHVFCVLSFNCVPSPQHWSCLVFISESFPLRVRVWLTPSPCLAHLFATGWTKTLGHNTLRTSENFRTVPKLFSYCVFSPLLSSWWNYVWNGFVAPQREKYFLSVKKRCSAWRSKRHIFLTASKKSTQPKSWATRRHTGKLRDQDSLPSPKQGSEPGNRNVLRQSRTLLGKIPLVLAQISIPFHLPPIFLWDDLASWFWWGNIFHESPPNWNIPDQFY